MMFKLPWSIMFKTAAYYSYLRSIHEHKVDKDDQLDMSRLQKIAIKIVRVDTGIILLFLAAFFVITFVFCVNDSEDTVYCGSILIAVAYTGLTQVKDLIFRMGMAYVMPLYVLYREPLKMKNYIFGEVTELVKNDKYVMAITFISTILWILTTLHIVLPPLTALYVVYGIMIVGFFWYAYVALKAYSITCKAAFVNMVDNKNWLKSHSII